jgi:hypothetical protein
LLSNRLFDNLLNRLRNYLNGTYGDNFEWVTPQKMVVVPFKQLMPTPLDAESVFFGGDYWIALFAQHRAPPKQSKRKHLSKTLMSILK